MRRVPGRLADAPSRTSTRRRQRAAAQHPAAPCRLVVPRDLEQRMPGRRIVLGDQLPERLRHGSVFEPGPFAVQHSFKTLRRAGIEHEERGQVAPPVLDVSRATMQRRSPTCGAAGRSRARRVRSVRQDARQEAPALNRAAFERRRSSSSRSATRGAGDSVSVAGGFAAASAPPRRHAMGSPSIVPSSVQRPVVATQDTLLLEAGEVVLDVERRAVG